MESSILGRVTFKKFDKREGAVLFCLPYWLFFLLRFLLFYPKIRGGGGGGGPPLVPPLIIHDTISASSVVRESLSH